MLPFNHRLNLRFHRQRLSTTGNTVSTPYFTYLIAKRDATVTAPIRLAFIVSKKIIPTAVGRNRFRRHLSENIRKNITGFPPDIDVIIIPKRKSLTTDISLLLNDIKTILNRYHVYS